MDTAFLLELRTLAVHHAEALRAALKHPSGDRHPRRNSEFPTRWRAVGRFARSRRGTHPAPGAETSGGRMKARLIAVALGAVIGLLATWAALALTPH
jgi:hypothetical protein